MTRLMRMLFVFVFSTSVLTACDDDEMKPDDVGSDVVDDADDVTTDTDDTFDTEDDMVDGGGFEGFPVGEPGPITELYIDGLENTVELKYTEDGIPSILCDSDADCAATLGYVHARDRFSQMDIYRRVVRGTLSEIVAGGEDIVNFDAASRALFSTPEGRPIVDVLVENASDKTLELLEAYSNGVNSWLDDLRHGRNGASLSEEYGFSAISLGDEISPWTPEDSLASVAALVENVTNVGGTDLSYGAMYANISADEDYDLSVWNDYFRPRPFTDSTIIDDYTYPSTKSGDVMTSRDLRLADAVPAMLEAQQTIDRIHEILGVAEDRGSNSWVVGPDMTASGDALLSNDSHLGFSNPSVWYIAHLDARTVGGGDIHSAGLTFAGLPYVIIGQNEDIAWGLTATYLDLSDVYIEELTEDGTGVVFDGTDVPFIEVTNTFHQVVGGDATRTALYVPHHGPVLSIDEEAGTAITLRWTGNLITTDANAITELNMASSATEARAALRNVTSIGQNWVVIDTGGDFGWFPYNTVPERPWASVSQPAYLPLDGTGGNEWDGFVAYADLPQAYNPTKGYLATANNDFTGALADGDPTNDGHPMMQSHAAVGYRQERIVDRLEASDQHTPVTMLDIVGDTYSIVGELLSPEFLTVDRTALTANAQALYDAIDDWDLECPTGLVGSDPEGDASSVQGDLDEALGCAAFHRVLSDVYRGWSADERAANEWNRGPSYDSLFRAILRPSDLTNPDLLWDDVTTSDVVETQDDILTQAFEDAADNLEAAVGDDPTDWLWGRVHTMTMTVEMFSIFNLDTFDEGPFARAGGFLTVNVANPFLGSSRMNVRSGPSMRLICEAPDSGVTCEVQLPGGEPHHRSLDNYLGLFERWQMNEPIDLVFDHAALDADVIPGNPPAM